MERMERKDEKREGGVRSWLEEEGVIRDWRQVLLQLK